MASSSSDSVEVERLAQQDLTSEDERYAAANLNETDETREPAITEIRRWIEECDNASTKIDDFLVLRFLRVCKFDLEKAKIRMRNYYKQRIRLSEWFLNKDPFRPEMQELLDMGLILCLRKPDSQGRLVIIVRCTQHDPSRHKLLDITKIALVVVEVATRYYTATSVYGCTVYLDVVSPTIQQILQLRPHFIMNVIHMWQSCYPMRYQTLNVFNASILFDTIVTISKSFMSEKMKKRVHVYSSALDCFKDTPPEILPVEYGGTDGTIQELTEYWKKLVEENREWILKEENETNAVL
ncbi:PREDICTED: alpha-tocopherol transfer protein-like isoform X2 [Vollenhovia emeryi]|uniref:alpha-tocopherol transfer protein-like isoform X2 n=1 Tax=Vollenhovia emeryi TaxID=411798 RepID=UPI0005F3610C|nr:PREDICTED: alpha-tocopherol transfer protein-like isoform X2 [Vollenhovia emeryi]